MSFYRKFGFTVLEGSAFIPAETGRPRHVILLEPARKETPTVREAAQAAEAVLVASSCQKVGL